MRTLTLQAPDNALQSFQHSPLIFHEYLVRMTAYIAQHRSEFELLLNRQQPSNLFLKLRQLVVDIWKRNRFAKVTKLPAEYLQNAISYLVVGEIETWLYDRENRSADELADIIQKLVAGLYQAGL